MGKRREPRKDIRVAVRLFGTDRNGRVFSEKLSTVNVSRCGVELSGLTVLLKTEEIVGLSYGQIKAHFRVKWMGDPGTPKAGHAGLLNVAPEKPLWDFPLPAPAFDGSSRDALERRRHPRVRTANSVELYPAGQSSPIRARTGDISLGGCFVDMPNPLPKGTTLRIGVWINEVKLWANALVVTSTPGFGIGIRFSEISDLDRDQLRQFLGSISRVPI